MFQWQPFYVGRQKKSIKMILRPELTGILMFCCKHSEKILFLALVLNRAPEISQLVPPDILLFSLTNTTNILIKATMELLHGRKLKNRSLLNYLLSCQFVCLFVCIGAVV